MAKQDNELEAAIFCLGLGGTMVWGALRRIRRRRLAQDTPHTEIASAAQGQTEIQGFAWPLAGTSLTLAGRQAVYHELVLEKLVKQGKSSSWRRQWGRSHKQPFYVLDTTGSVLVRPERAEAEVKWETWRWDRLPGPAKARVPSMGISVSGFPPTSLLFGIASSGSFRFRECSILLGAPVYVHGTLTAGKKETYIPASLPLQRFLGFLRTMRKRSVSSNMGFDRNRDGRICEDEAEQALNEIGEKAFSDLRAGEQPPLPGQAAAGSRIYGEVAACADRNLYLADCHQEHLLKRLGGSNFLLIIGGALLCGFGVFGLLKGVGVH